MKKKISHIIFAFLCIVSFPTIASICDNSQITLINSTAKKLTLNALMPYGSSTISADKTLINPGETATLTALSGPGSQGDAKGFIKVQTVDPLSTPSSIDLEYVFLRHHGLLFNMHCHSLTSFNYSSHFGLNYIVKDSLGYYGPGHLTFAVYEK